MWVFGEGGRAGSRKGAETGMEGQVRVHAEALRRQRKGILGVGQGRVLAKDAKGAKKG